MNKLFLSAVIILFSFFFFPVAVFANNNADPVNSSVSLSPTSIPADGATTATIAVTVKDSLGNLLGGDHITLTNTSADSGLIINEGTVGALDFTAATDGNGKVSFTVKSRNPSPGTDTLTVTDASSNPVITLGSVRLAFTASALAPNSACTSGAPGGTPKLNSAVENGANKITLTWTTAANPVSHYLVAYGIASGQYIYGNPNVGGQGTTSYTVTSLAEGTKYYFVVKAINGCNPGSYSNELSAVVGGTVTVPTKSNSSLKNNNIQDVGINKPWTTPTDMLLPTEILPSQSTTLPTSTPIPTQTFVNSAFGLNKNIAYGILFIGIITLAVILYLRKFKNK